MNDRLLKESDVIEVVTQYISYDYPTEEMAREDAEVLIGRTPSADRPQEWIPCSERLPSEKDYIGDVVIWCTDKSIVGVGWYYESTKSWATIDDTFPPILGEVIAWMPLPEPWKGADDE